MIKTVQLVWKEEGWEFLSENLPIQPQLCLLFGSRINIQNSNEFITKLQAKYPNTQIITTSTAGNIVKDTLIDDAIIATCVEFEKTTIEVKKYSIIDKIEKDLGELIANDFNKNNLSNILLFSTTGLNAGNLLDGINIVFKGKIGVSGGVAGDDLRFEKTLVGLNTDIEENQIVVIGFYSNHLSVTHGTKGGWDKFGPIRTITKAAENVLYEIDNKPVLNLYKMYLGDKAAELPASGLLFPFAIIDDKTQELVVRGIQNIDEEAKSLILFGNVFEGQKIQLMHANFDQLISGAGESANESLFGTSQNPSLSILISCVARRMVLGQMTEEELVESSKVLGPNATICGFYSYSELSPLVSGNVCHLHNQTMTITSMYEN